MAFKLTPNVTVDYDPTGRVRELEHLRQPFTAKDAGLADASPVQLANQYLRDVAQIYHIDPAMLAELAGEHLPALSAQPPRLRLAHESSATGSMVVSYSQTVLGVDVWESGIAVNLLSGPWRVTSSRSTLHEDVKVQLPGPRARYLGERVTAAVLARLLGIKGGLKLQGTRVLIYRYDPNSRLDLKPGREQGQTIGLVPSPGPSLPVPPVPRTIIASNNYVVTEALFGLEMPGWGEVNWRAFIEVNTGAVLYLRAFVAACTGDVYLTDPPTATGNGTITPASPATTLDPLKTTVTLDGLTSANPQTLSGQYVTVQSDASHTAPTTASPPCAFTGSAYSVVSSNFAAVNCYYHLDELFRAVVGWGYSPVTTFFTQTTFPVSAYFFSEGATVNAHANGGPGGSSLSNYSFGSCQSGAPVGITVDWRVVMHEFNHHVLYDRIHSADYGFAHNGGDAFGSIWMDPTSQAPDKGLNFPWISAIPRRHDRPVTTGWAWGGTFDDGGGGYQAEEILATCLFRVYRSYGGDSTDLNVRTLSSQYLLYLKLHADATLGPATITPTPTATPYVTALITADAAVTNFQGNPGGALGKVFRWAFEKQGLYQPASAPTPVVTAGAPPAVDVYIDDGRGGEYQYIAEFWENTDIWNRLAADGGTTHQNPVIGVTNYVYVRVKNRGTQAANNVVVYGFHCQPSTGLLWPSDWQAMTTAQLAAGGPIPAGGQTVIGPFQWTPTVIGHECLLMYANADGDLSNADAATGLPCATGPTPHWRLVPFDNNIGQRNVAPVAGGGGVTGLAASIRNRRFRVNNPYDRVAEIELEVELPAILQKLGWKLEFSNPGGSKFRLGPLSSREVVMTLVPGGDFSPQEVGRPSEATIRVRTKLNGLAIGGMSYALDPSLKSPPREFPSRRKRRAGKEAAEALLEALDLSDVEVREVHITRVTIDIDLEVEDDEDDE